MSEAVIHLVTRETIELHFEGAAYGPVAHAEQLGALLFFLAPGRVRCIANGRPFEQAMDRLLAAARQASAQLEQASPDTDFVDSVLPVPDAVVQCWVDAAFRAVPKERMAEFQRRYAERMKTPTRRQAVH